MGLDIFIDRVKRQTLKNFRKVNFLVGYFSMKKIKLQNTVPIEITKEEAQELINKCNRVLENHDLAPQLLPTTHGFFFGSVEYDDYYFKDVEDVKNFFESLLEKYENLPCDEAITITIDY